MPRVSVIIPVFNTEDYVDECLESVLGQSLEDIEVICVNDGSSDGTPQRLDHWESRDERVRLVTQANAGPGAARNVGLEMAVGEYLCFVDDDDILLPGALQELVDRAAASNLDVLYYDASPFCSDADLEADFRWFEAYYRRSRVYEGVMPGSELMGQMVKNSDYRTTAWSMLVRNDYCRSIGLRFPEGILHEDNVFSFLCGIQARRAEYLPKVLYHRRIRRNSIMTMAKVEAHFAGLFHASAEMLRFMTHNELDRQTMQMGSVLCARVYRQAVAVYGEIPADLTARVVDEGTTAEAMALGRIIIRDGDAMIRAKKMGEQLKKCEHELLQTKAQLKRVRESKAYRFARTVRRIARFGR